MKKKLILCASVMIALIAVGAGSFFLFLRQPPVYIAVAAPLSGAMKTEGRAMVRGISLCLDEINQAGGIDGRKVRLRVFNDRSQPKGAAEAAAEIAEYMDILLVLGHYTSPASVMGGRTYRKNGIPAITASATADPVTSGNEWYFRTISNNSSQGSFIAGYVSKSLNKDAASIIYSQDIYGMTLAEHFEKTARELGLEIRKKWKFQPDSSTLNNDLKRVAAELRAMEDPGMIFVAVPGEEAPKLISSLKFPGTDYSIIGPDTFTSGSFLEEFGKYPQERAKPGYFTNGIYAVAPFLKDIANEKAQVFSEKFIRKHGTEPSWIAACYYDAAMVAAEAIRRVGVHGEEEIRKDRREIREFLAGMSTLDIAVRGITGPIYFDKNRDARAPFLPVVVYKNQKLYPAYSQYQPGHKIGDDSLKKALDGEIIALGEKVMNKTDIVYTGISVKEITDLDVRQSVFTADFHVWFRYKGDFSPENIVFVNAVRPVMLEYPVVDKKDGNMTFQSFHLRADFRNTFDFHAFPFDDHHLRISFRHAEHTREKLIYTSVISEFDKSIIRLDPLSGWEIRKARFYQDIITDSAEEDQDFSYSQKVISYSQFNADIHIQRKGPDVALRWFLPLAVIALALYMTYFIPYHRYGSRTVAVMFALAAVSVYHWKLLSETEVAYWSTAEYVIFVIYGLVSLSVGVTVGISVLSLRKKTFLIRQLNRWGKVFHGAVVLAAGFGIWWLKG